jgi:hypothetical protein
MALYSGKKLSLEKSGKATPIGSHRAPDRFYTLGVLFYVEHGVSRKY